MLSTPVGGLSIDHMFCARRGNLSIASMTSFAALSMWLVVTSLVSRSCCGLFAASVYVCLVSSFTSW